MNLLKLYSLILLGSATLSAPAMAMCQYREEIDLRKTERGFFHNNTIKDQGSYGICYAYAASTLIDFVRMKKKSEGHQYGNTDPTAAAILSTSIMEEMSIEGGSICDVVKGLKKAGYGCTTSAVSVNQIKGFGASIHQSLLNLVFMPYVLKEKKFVAVDPKMYPLKVRKKFLPKLSADQKTYLAHMDEFMKVLVAETSLRGFSRNQLPSDEKLFEFFQNVQIQNRWAALEADATYLLISKTCQSTKFSMPAISCENYSKSQYGLIDLVDDSLRKGHPTGAYICSNFLGNKKYKGAAHSKLKSDCEGHAVVIIGKREHGGFCQYLIRNSWGTNSAYDWQSSDGDIWVDEFALKDNFYEAQLVR